MASWALSNSPSRRTNVTSSGDFKKTSRRLPWWYANAPNDSSRNETCELNRQGDDASNASTGRGATV